MSIGLQNFKFQHFREKTLLGSFSKHTYEIINMDKIKFSGGDTLEGTQKKLHEILIQTELNNGLGAYEISYAETREGGNSGLSFGGNQMDLSNNKNIKGYNDTYLNVFLDIVSNATKDNALILSEAEYKTIKIDDITAKGLKPETVFGDLLPKVNAALSSEYGIAKLNEVYRHEIKSTLDHVYKCVNSMNKYSNKKAILENEEIILRLADFHNQFGLSERGKMMEFLEGKKVYLSNEKEGSNNPSYIKLQLTHTPQAQDIKDFIRATNQYHKDDNSSRGLENRLAKLDKYFGHEPEVRPVDSYDLNPNVTQIEVGNLDTNSLSGQAKLHSHSLNVFVDKEHMKSMNVSIKYDDHAWLTVNNDVVFESTPDLHNYSIETKNGKRWVVTPSSKFPAETYNAKKEFIDITDTVHDGHNNVTLNVLVEDGGVAHMIISYI
jgi:hypothetical protein